MPGQIIYRMDIFIKNKNKFSKHKRNPSNSETEIEIFLEKNPHILEKNLEIIGRQVKIKSNGQKIDLLGLDSENNLIVIEIKKGKAKYDAIGQGRHYHMWASHIKLVDFVYLMDKQNLKIPQRLRSKKIGNKHVKFNNDPRLYVIAEFIDDDAINDARNLLKDEVDIECVEIQFYNNKIVTINKLLGTSIINSDNIPKCDKATLALFTKIKKWINNSFNNPNEVRTTNYFAYKCHNHNFVTLHISRHKIKAHFVTYDLNDPQKLTKQHEPKRLNGRVWEMIVDESNFLQFKNFAKQAHKNTCQ